MLYVGIDIGSTAAKVAVLSANQLLHYFALPTGWNCKETAENIKNNLFSLGIDPENAANKTYATGYGRISVAYAERTLSEITCHGAGSRYIFKEDATVVDIGGQDTKIITMQNGRITDFLMNDKCSAGTGKFIEIMAGRLGLDIEELCSLAEKGEPVAISSMCTVFAESEIISYISKGEKRENISSGILDSVVSKVSLLCRRHGTAEKYFLSGGLCQNAVIGQMLSRKLGKPVQSSPLGWYAGAIGAAVLAEENN